MKPETLEGLREYAFREGSDEDPLSIEVGALIQAYDKLKEQLSAYQSCPQCGTCRDHKHAKSDWKRFVAENAFFLVGTGFVAALFILAWLTKG